MRIGILLLFLAFIISCGQKNNGPSEEGVLPKEKFISVLIDMYMLEGKYTHAALLDKPMYEKGIKEYEQLFKKHGTDKKTVEKTFDYYTQKPEEMNQIFSAVLDSLNLKSNPK